MVDMKSLATSYFQRRFEEEFVDDDNDELSEEETKNYPSFFPLFFIDIGKLTGPSQSLATMSNNVWRLSLFMLIINLTTWIVLLSLSNQGAGTGFGIAIGMLFLAFPLFLFAFERSFFALWRNTTARKRKAMLLQLVNCIVLIFYALGGYGSFNGWTRFFTIKGDHRVVWVCMTIFESVGWTSISLLAAINLSKYYEDYAEGPDPVVPSIIAET